MRHDGIYAASLSIVIFGIRACSHKNEMHIFSANFGDYCVENT